MFSTIFQLSNRPIEKREYIGIEHVGQGDMVFMDYTCEIDNEDRKREIKNLAGRILPEGMFTLNADETLAYNGGFTEWRKTYLDLIRKRTDALTEKNIMEWAGTAYTFRKPYSIRSPRTAFSSRSFVTDTERLNGQGNSCGWLKRLQQGKNYISGR